MQKVSDTPTVWPRIEAATGIETRATILGHMQRGGSPTAKDRVYASMMGAYAVDLLCAGERATASSGYQNGKFMDIDMDGTGNRKACGSLSITDCPFLENKKILWKKRSFKDGFFVCKEN